MKATELANISTDFDAMNTYDDKPLFPNFRNHKLALFINLV